MNHPPHNWNRTVAPDHGVVVWQCANCKRYLVSPPADSPGGREVIERIDAGGERGKYGNCGIPMIGETWRAGEISGIVTLIQADRSFWIRDRWGQLFEFPVGTPDETPLLVDELKAELA